MHTNIRTSITTHHAFSTYIHDVVHTLGAGRVSDGYGAEERGLEAGLSLAVAALQSKLRIVLH